MSDASGAAIARVDQVLTAFFDERAESFASLGADLVAMSDAGRRFVLDGGKRLRPRFAYWAWRSVHRADADDCGLVTAAASLELLHACALVHDDLIDSSDTRRGRPAAHTAFARLHREQNWSGDPHAFGTAAAILLGDLLLCWSDAMFASATIAPDRLPAARHAYDDMRQLVLAGQYLDVLVQARAAFSTDEALRVVKYKTSKYTVEGPLHLGAAIAGASTATFEALSSYGSALGEAFQLRDDVLGMFGDPAVTGKPAGDDLREGKQTLLTALAMRAADTEQAALLRRGLGDRALGATQVDALRQVVVTTGALEQVERRITERAGQALAALDTGSIAADARRALGELVASATSRHS